MRLWALAQAPSWAAQALGPPLCRASPWRPAPRARQDGKSKMDSSIWIPPIRLPFPLRPVLPPGSVRDKGWEAVAAEEPSWPTCRCSRASVAPAPPGSSRGSQAPDASRVTQVRAELACASLRLDVGAALHPVTEGLSGPGRALRACWGEGDPSLIWAFRGAPDALCAGFSGRYLSARLTQKASFCRDKTLGSAVCMFLVTSNDSFIYSMSAVWPVMNNTVNNFGRTLRALSMMRRIWKSQPRFGFLKTFYKAFMVLQIELFSILLYF